MSGDVPKSEFVRSHEFADVCDDCKWTNQDTMEPWLFCYDTIVQVDLLSRNPKKPKKMAEENSAEVTENNLK